MATERGGRPARTGEGRRSLERCLSRLGVASRTEARALVLAGRVRLNGRVVWDPALRVDPRRTRIEVDGERIRARRRRVLAYNKPRGLLVTAHDPHGRATIYDRLPEELHRDPALRAVGRLDRSSAGLLLLTNDTDLAAAVLEPASRVAKRYRVKVTGRPSERALRQLRAGVDIGDPTRTAPARVVVERRNRSSAVLRISIEEGRNRQIRRMAAAVGLRVEWLVRTAIGPIELGDLAPGEVRPLTAGEIEALAACGRG